MSVLDERMRKCGEGGGSEGFKKNEGNSLAVTIFFFYICYFARNEQHRKRATESSPSK